MKDLDNLYASVLTGFIQTVAFQPIDKAIYLSSINRRQLFIRENFVQPYHGCSLLILHRIISNSSYFFCQGHFEEQLNNKLELGLAIGFISCSISYPISSLRFYGWNNQNYTPGQVWEQIRHQKNPLKLLYRGVIPNIIRDVIFAASYEYSRTYLNNKYNPNKNLGADLFYNFLAASASIVLSSPINVYRNFLFTYQPTSEQKIPNFLEFYKNMTQEAKLANRSILQEFNLRSRLPAVTIRFGVGMAAGQEIYKLLTTHK